MVDGMLYTPTVITTIVGARTRERRGNLEIQLEQANATLRALPIGRVTRISACNPRGDERRAVDRAYAKTGKLVRGFGRKD